MTYGCRSFAHKVLTKKSRRVRPLHVRVVPYVLRCLSMTWVSGCAWFLVGLVSRWQGKTEVLGCLNSPATSSMSQDLWAGCSPPRRTEIDFLTGLFGMHPVKPAPGCFTPPINSAIRSDWKDGKGTGHRNAGVRRSGRKGEDGGIPGTRRVRALE